MAIGTMSSTGNNTSGSEQGGNGQGGPGNVPPDSPNVTRIPNSEDAAGRVAYIMPIPHGVQGGQSFPVTIGGQRWLVPCPQNARPGMKVRFVPGRPPDGPMGRVRPRRPERPSEMQVREGVIPAGAKPGRPFSLLVDGVRVLMRCPADASEGQRIEFNLPLALAEKVRASNLAKIKLAYDKDGWTRTIRVSDMKFQWIRMDASGNVDTNKRFDAKTAAYVRKLELVNGNGTQLRTGLLSLVTANDPAAVVESFIKGPDGRSDLVSYADIAAAQVMAFEDKVQWFQDTCAQLCADCNEEYIPIKITRKYLLGDSMEAVLGLSRKDLRKKWIFQFIGEAGIDAGGLAREWFQLVTEEIFDPDMGLWKSSATNQMLMEINPACEFCCPEDHLLYFRFLGRVMGKALYDSQLVAGHMISTLYKHMCGWPCQFADLEQVDEEIYDNLKKLLDMDRSEVESLCLDFTVTEETMGMKQTVELVPGGADIDVTGDNLPEYMEAVLQYKMMGRVKPQLCELLLGFFDVIPDPILTIFDFQELELIMCGLPEIDLHDWRDNTEYSGKLRGGGSNNDVVRWFWEVVEEMDQEMRARLLQFATGTSGVPSRGFAVLQGNDGNVRKFTVHGIEVGVCLYPRGHTCFNRIDLPMYDDKAELKQKLELAVAMNATGFDIE